MKTNAQKDANHKQINDELVRLGYATVDISQIKNAFDLLVCCDKGNFIFEIKNPEYLRKNYTQYDLNKKLSKGELECKQRIEKAGGSYYVVATIEEILNIINHAKN